MTEEVKIIKPKPMTVEEFTKLFEKMCIGDSKKVRWCLGKVGLANN